jgi:hypothetical protein
MGRFRTSGPTGAATILDPDAPVWEHDTVTCKHCERIIFTVPGTLSMQYLIYHPSTQQWTTEMGAFCRRCMAPVCLACDAIGTCRPWERQMEELERHGRRG